ncbi:LOW QUALITY PROTEIN: sterol 26-hydroxylase, mitochondrial [Erpetoichthys calabaricus]|uniref:LOW QUALITY PROTEIN: sterol 26-hydroxylase, mitochondrial n=1 Tax=Erpetoichthys calabaricus TaxID=27687 RepID=UPI002234A9B8|nr:LOW QUALITY PROTEIN: sterol 26-hydroxylase, mitochondrial [Erpetoichthys calabaricus]
MLLTSFHRAAARAPLKACRTAIWTQQYKRTSSSSASTSSSSAATSTVLSDRTSFKSIEELNGPSFPTSLYWFFIKGYFDKVHQLQIEHKKIYGPIWKSKYGPLVVVNVASAELIEQVIRQEGKYPIRTDMPHWRGYRELRKQAYGPLTEMGPEWQRIRSILNPKMLKPKHVSTFSPAINLVVTDFIQKIGWLREKENGLMVRDMASELYKFAFEGICYVLFETRMGCLEKIIPQETQQFIDSVGEMFRLSPILVLFPKSVWPYLPFWKSFVATWDHLFKVAKRLIDTKVVEIKEKMEKGEEVEGEYLTHLLISQKMSVDEILGSITELLLAGVDTTSNTISWALYHMAREPTIQEKLCDEVNRVCPEGQIPQAEDLAKMPWLKAIVKETLRLYPVVPGNARVVPENETVVGDYYFPKKVQTLFHLCHYAVSYEEEHFPDPPAFLPERWLRGGDKMKQHPFSSIPFGFGIRACLGKRVAELEMYCLLSRLIRHFEVRPDPSGLSVEAKTRTLLVPSSPINLQFLDRQ